MACVSNSAILILLAAETEDEMSGFFTYEERLLLQKHLKEGLSFKKIAAMLQKDPSNVPGSTPRFCIAGTAVAMNIASIS